EQGSEADVARVDPALREYGLDPERRTKLERGLLRLSRDLSEPLLLLPDERAAIERFAERGDALLRRRARVLLLDARGYRADTVAGQTGLSAARVRYWKEQFLARRLGIFEPDAEPARAYRISELVEAPPREQAAPDAGIADPLIPASPDATPPMATPTDATPAEESPAEATPPEGASPVGDATSTSFPTPTGDGAAEPRGLDALLDQFAPSDTATPFLDSDEPDDQLDDLDPDDESDLDKSNDDLTTPDAVAERTEPTADDASDASLTDAVPLASTLRAPVFGPETPLVDAAFAMLVYHVARFERGADRLDADPADARRVLLAAHRVRLAAEAFRPYVPAMAAERLVSALRPLVTALDDVLDHDRAAAVPGADAAHGDARDEALGRVRALLRSGRHRAWGPRARRLLDRLGAQHDAGLLVGDDFPAPPDDLIGEPGDVPVPSRLRHAAASMLWARYEAIRAFEDDVVGTPSAETAYHLALAVSGLHFVLGIVSHVPSPPVRALAERLDAAEARLAAYRTALRTAELTGAPAAPSSAVTDVWDDLVSDDFRQTLADVAARI
ncbi:MAG TPA: hypothetical protein VF594_05215, partial [Rubricoccaceae bacterium]